MASSQSEVAFAKASIRGSARIMSRNEVSPAQLSEIAELCGLSEDQIEDVYSCTTTQVGFTLQGRTSTLVFVYEIGPDADIDRSLGYVQAVTNVAHETERVDGDPFEYAQRPEVYDRVLGQQLFRTTCIDRHLVVGIHHNVMDNFSWNTFLNVEIAGVYQGLPQQKRAPYKEFVKQCLELDESAATSFWKPRFQGVPAIFPKPLPNHRVLNKIRPPRKIPLEHIGTKVPVFQVPSYIEIAWVLTASIYADSDKIAYGMILAGRSPDLDSHTGWLGPMLVGVPLQANIQRTMSIEQLLKDRVVSLRQLQKEPILLQFGMDRISDISEASKVASEFQAILNFRAPVQKTTESSSDASLATLRGSYNMSSCFPLEIISAPMDDGISMDVNQDRDVIPDEEMERVLNQLEHTIRAIMDAPPQTKIDQLRLLNRHDHAQILSFNETTPQKLEGCIHSLFKEKVNEYPDSTAIEGTDGSATYQELDRLSDRLAHHLRANGVKLEDRIGHAFANSLWAIVAILGTIKAGAVCVPIGINEESDQIGAFLSQTGIRTVLTSPTEDVHFTDTGAKVSSHLAFITSSDASTGPSKRVLIEHSSVVSGLVPLLEQLKWHPESRILHTSPYTSKYGLTEALGALLAGSRLCIAPKGMNGTTLSSFLGEHKVTWAMLPATALQGLSAESLPSIEGIILTSGLAKSDPAASWAKNSKIFNAWGPCEAAGFSTIAKISGKNLDHSSEDIGIPIGCSLWIANARDINQLAPIGGVGELVVEGPHIGRSYLDDVKQTTATFIPPPEWVPAKDKQARFLRTGQLAKYNADRSISLVGRVSNRVKVGKETIQLEEIENLLARCNEIREVVAISKIIRGRTNLIGLVSLSDPRLPSAKVFQPLGEAQLDVCKEHLMSVRTQLACKVASHKVPTTWIVLERLPQTPSQRINRTAVSEWMKAGKGDKCSISI
ncbi:hypothetical protein N7470_007154 [Penicillium chermesinum]|nr:hypothetical protein N7470_007154 [Penicillium chermesinum]